MKNLRPDLNGVIAIDKPRDWTSADVCRLLRKLSGGAKIGHAGTLDPLATGVLVLCFGRATKRIPDLMDGQKRYTATVDLANRSPTDDLEGELEPVGVDQPPARDDVEKALESFTGPIMQIPPAHSAVWVDGKRAYHLARAGENPDIKARPVVIESIEILEYEWPRLVLDVRCGKGTYIRSLARDVGLELGTGGVLAGLVRTESSGFTLDQCADLSDLEPEGAVERAVLASAGADTPG